MHRALLVISISLPIALAVVTEYQVVQLTSGWSVGLGPYKVIETSALVCILCSAAVFPQDRFLQSSFAYTLWKAGLIAITASTWHLYSYCPACTRLRGTTEAAVEATIRLHYGLLFGVHLMGTVAFLFTRASWASLRVILVGKGLTRVAMVIMLARSFNDPQFADTSKFYPPGLSQRSAMLVGLCQTAFGLVLVPAIRMRLSYGATWLQPLVTGGAAPREAEQTSLISEVEPRGGAAMRSGAENEPGGTL